MFNQITNKHPHSPEPKDFLRAFLLLFVLILAAIAVQYYKDVHH